MQGWKLHVPMIQVQRGWFLSHGHPAKKIDNAQCYWQFLALLFCFFRHSPVYPRWSRSEILSESSHFFERYFDAFRCVIASLHSFLHSFTSQFCFTPHFPKGFQEFPSSKVRFKLRGFLLGEASTVAAAADCGAPIWRRFAFRARINRGCLRRHGESEWLKMIGTLIFLDLWF